MLVCNLKILMAERNLKITKIAKDTGISRTTLTSLANNYSQGIQFDTLNSLCKYLNVLPNDFFSYSNFEILISPIIELDNIDFSYINIPIQIKENSFVYNCKLFFKIQYTKGETNIFLKLTNVDNLKDFINFYNSLNIPLLNKFEEMLITSMNFEELYPDHFYNKSDEFFNYIFNWNYIISPNSHKL